ncbi:MAG: helix-turn-helix domain-containing protein, partial [Caldilineae bacterium]
MRKKERLLEELKRATGPLSAGELAEQVGCSSRHVRRLIEQLQEEGHPIRRIERGPQTRYELQGIPEVEKAISSIDLSEQQVLLLLLSLYMTMHSLKDTSLYKQLVELIRRVRETMNPELVYWLKDNPELETRLF